MEREKLHQVHQLTPMKRWDDIQRLSDVEKLSAHVTRILGQNPGQMTLQGTNTYLLQPPSSATSPLILIDTSSPHTAQQYVDLLFTHLYHLGLGSGVRETHFESVASKNSFKPHAEETHDALKAQVLHERKADPRSHELGLVEYGQGARWAEAAKTPRKLPAVEHIILTHRHLDHVGALPVLLATLKEHGCPPPKIWKFPSPDEAALSASERDAPTADACLVNNLPPGTYQPMSPFQPLHPIIPGLMISIIDPAYKHLLKYDAQGKPKWNDVPEVARVSLRCLRTPGHTADSVSLVMCEGEKGVFTGDTVLGQGTTVFTDLASYMTSLKTILALKPKVLYPAHGPHIITPEKCTSHIENYISHRQQREDEIVAILSAAKADPAWVGQEVVELLKRFDEENYKDKKYKEEFMSGKPWVPKDETKKEKKKDGEKGNNKKDDEESAKEAEAEADKVKAQQGQDDKVRALFTPCHALGLHLLCKLIYKTQEERTIFAAQKSITAHLVKLEREGKVKRCRVDMPRVVEGKAEEKKTEEEGWKWVDEAVKETAE